MKVKKEYYHRVNNLWYNFIVLQFPNNIEVNINEFRIVNYNGASVDITNQFGFLTLEFHSKEIKNSFVDLADLKLKSPKTSRYDQNLKMVFNEVPVFTTQYPCRIFPECHKLKIAFYDQVDAHNLTVLDIFEIRLNILRWIIDLLQTLKEEKELKPLNNYN